MFLVIVSRKLGLPPRKVNLHAAVTPISQIGLVALTMLSSETLDITWQPARIKSGG